MPTWTTIPDSSLEPGKPIRSIDTLALRDNPVAIADGAAGAPRVALPAIVAALGNRHHAQIGTITVAWNITTTNMPSNGIIAGSNLRMVNAVSADPNASMFKPIVWALPSFPAASTTTLAGTWRNVGGFCRGRFLLETFESPDAYLWYPSIWLRIS